MALHPPALPCEQSPVRLALIIPFLLTAAALGQVRPAVERVDAILGYELLVPIVVEDEKALAGGRTLRIALDDGQEPAVSYFRLEQAGSTEAGWIGRVPTYRAVPGSEAARRAAQQPVVTPGVWYAVIDLPLEAVTQGIWFGSERYEINWLPDPERASLEAGGRPLWASPVPPEAQDSPALRAALRAVASDPFQAWRARLVEDGITPTGGEDRTGASGTDIDALREDLDTREGQRFLDALARQHAARWQLILGRLALIDPEAAMRMRRQLGGVVRIDETWMPFWTPDSPELRALQADLLSPWVDDQTRVLRALGWLDAQPKALAWVIDDAGEAGRDDGRLTTTLGLLSLPARDAPLLVELGGSAGSPVLETVPARAMRVMRTSVPMVERRGAGGGIRTVSVPVRIGRADTTTDAIATIPGARPPGVRVGPLLSEWTMPALMAGAPDIDALPRADRATVGTIRRSGRPGRGAADTGWSVFLECGAPDDEGPGADDAVILSTGPQTLPRCVWRIERDGTVHRLFGPSDLVRVGVVETPGGWALDAELPAAAIDEDGVLRIGFVRQTGEDRTSWPRRMTPGQDSPGRLPVDITRWSGF